MAVFGPIPLQAGFTSMGELADLMMAKRKMQQEKYVHEMQNAQRMKEAEQMNEYRMGALGVSRSAESREQALHKYKLAHEQAQALVDQRFAKQYSQGGQGLPAGPVSGPSSAPGPAPTDTSMLDNFVQSGNPEQPSRIPGSSPRVGTPPDVVRNHPDLDYQQRAAWLNQVGQNPGMSPPNAPAPQAQPNISPVAQAAAVTPQPGMPNQPQAAPQPQGNPPPQGSPFAERQQRLDKGEEVQTIGPRPGEAWKDDFAGQTHLGVKIKDIAPRTVDGIEYLTYPSGKEVAHKVGPSYEEKEEMKLNTAQTKLQAKSNIAASDKAEANGKVASKSASYIKAMVDAFVKDPKLTSWTYGIPIVGPLAAKAGGEGLGKFDAATAAYQAEAAKLASTRGGIGIVQFMKNTKPDRENSPERNIGMIMMNAEKVDQIYKEEKEEWEAKNPGKKFPVDDPKVVQYAQRLLGKKTVSVRDNVTGKITKMTQAEYDELARSHNG